MRSFSPLEANSTRRSASSNAIRGFNVDFSLVPVAMAPEQPASALIHQSHPVAIQKKLTIGSIDDPCEREADQIASLAVSSRQPMCGTEDIAAGYCSGGERHFPSQQPVSGSELLAKPGIPLPKTTRDEMQQHLGMDLHHVRIHTDAVAASAASAISARAFTLGSHIAFAPNQYAPDTIDGRRLLAHELVHVAQQAGGQRNAGARQHVVRRAAQAAPAVGAAAALGWCLSGAVISGLLDEALQVGQWLLRGSDRGDFRQNWCRTFIAALLGCVTGIAGGALRTILVELGMASGLTLGGLLTWLMAQGIRVPAHIVSFLGRQGCLEEEIPS